MNLFKMLIVPAVAMCALSSCSNEDDVTITTPNLGNGDDVYMSLTITQQYATRTTTGEQGTELGQDKENTVGNALVILTDKDFNVISYSQLVPESGNSWGSDWNASTNTLTKTGKFNKSQIESFMKRASTNDYEMHAFVVCNYDFSKIGIPIVGQPVQQTVHLSNASDLGGFVADNAFMMSGKNKVSNLNANSFENNSESNPFSLGTISVSRVVSRFDINTASTKFYFNADGNNKNATADNAAVTLTLDAVALVNMSKDFYLFKEVGGTGTQSISWEYYGTELTNNFVKDPFSNDVTDTKSSLSYTYFYPVKGSASNVANAPTFADYEYKSIATLSGGVQTSSSSDGPISDKDGNEWKAATWSDFAAWRYCVPNSIYKTDKQLNGNSTGVIFRAEMSVKDATISGQMTSGDRIYALNNIIYGNLSTLLESENLQVQNTLSVVLAEYNASNSSATKEEITAADEVTFLPYLAKYFSVFTKNADDNKYYCYYYYWNRHNDNGKELEMGEMEFAAVRNNVYKLWVDEIMNLGHPEIPSNDPDAVSPENPNETLVRYLSVSVTVLPWEGRVNKITF